MCLHVEGEGKRVGGWEGEGGRVKVGGWEGGRVTHSSSMMMGTTNPALAK